MSRNYMPAVMLLAIGTALAQTKVDLGNQARNIDFGSAVSVRPYPTGAGPLPAACSPGQMYFRTDAPAGLNTFACTAPNIWTPLAPSISTALSATRTSDTMLTLGAICTATNPCSYRIGTVVSTLTSPVTVTLNSGSGAIYVFIDAATGNVIVGVSALGSPSVSCDGCQIAALVNQYPAGSIPLTNWKATSGIWEASGTSGVAVLSAPPVISPGSNVTVTNTGNAITISASPGETSSSGSGGGTGSSFDPTDPTQWYRDHLSLASGFSNQQDGWGYTGGCGVGQATGAVGFSEESIVTAAWAQASAGGSVCLLYFPTQQNNTYGGNTYDYWSGETPSSLYVAATYKTADANGTHYVGLTSWVGNVNDFIGCRQSGTGNWFAVVRANGEDLAAADTGVQQDTGTHRIVVDNNSGAANTIRCAIDGGAPAVAAAQIPAEAFGWSFIFGAGSNGAADTVFAPFEYTIFLRGLPRR